MGPTCLWASLNCFLSSLSKVWVHVTEVDLKSFKYKGLLCNVITCLLPPPLHSSSCRFSRTKGKATINSVVHLTTTFYKSQLLEAFKVTVHLWDPSQPADNAQNINSFTPCENSEVHEWSSTVWKPVHTWGRPTPVPEGHRWTCLLAVCMLTGPRTTCSSTEAVRPNRGNLTALPHITGPKWESQARPIPWRDGHCKEMSEKKIAKLPWLGGLVAWSVVAYTKGYGINSQTGHIHRFDPWSGRVLSHECLCSLLPPSLTLSLNQ